MNNIKLILFEELLKWERLGSKKFSGEIITGEINRRLDIARNSNAALYSYYQNLMRKY